MVSLHRTLRDRDGRGLVAEHVLYVGVAQEKQKVFRTSKRRNPVTGATYPWLVPASGRVSPPKPPETILTC